MNPHAEEIATTLDARESRHVPALDGLRGLAVFMVVACHFSFFNHEGRGKLVYAVTTAWGGLWVGVDLFFVLSGFLITGILLQTLQRPDYFRGFYIRRSLRIFPLYYLVLFLLLMLTPLLHIRWNGSGPYLLVYLQNYIDFARLSFHTPHFPINLTHFWSLAVEEQFYLVWPLVVWKLRESKTLFYVLISVVIICPIVRMLLVQRGFSPLRLYLWTPFRIDALCWGALAAYCVRNFTARRVELAGAIALFAGIAAVLLIAIKRHGFDEYDGMVAGFGYTSLGLLFSGVLVRLLRMKSWSASFFSVSPLRTLGKYSYGIYVYHWLLAPLFVWTGLICARATGSKGVGILVPLLMAFVVTVPLAMLSYRFYERPWLNLKDRWAPR